jgi:hypothetical protein
VRYVVDTNIAIAMLAMPRVSAIACPLVAVERHSPRGTPALDIVASYDD